MSLALGEEVVTPDEHAVVADFIAFLKEASLARAGTGPIRRFNQTRTTGCVRAEFSVPEGLADDLRVGLFAQELKTPQPVSVKRLDKIWAQAFA